MKVSEYFEDLLRLMDVHPLIAGWDCAKEVRTAREGFVKARIAFIDGSWLDFREFVNCSGSAVLKYTYSYHYQSGETFVFRYDNTPHHPDLESFPHHKHLASGIVIPSHEPTLAIVLDEIDLCIARSTPK